MTTDVAPAPTLSASALSVSYPGSRLHALSQIDLTIEPGSLVAVWGPNGAGKSTLLKTLAGLLRPSAGHVSLGARDLASFPRRELARTVAYLPQTARSDLPFTVREVVLMGRAPRVGRFSQANSGDLASVEAALEGFDLKALEHRAITMLSGGERRRVALARVFAQQTPVLLLDEPTAALDVKHQTRTYARLAKAARVHQRTVVAVTHDLNLSARPEPQRSSRHPRRTASGRAARVVRPGGRSRSRRGPGRGLRSAG
ncbi:MAG: ABC transporter ATP-binding protein [Planctomycetota bacterium]|jgi:iron complex transport system ATP-binding protein